MLVSIACIAIAGIGTAFSATLLRNFSNTAGFEGHMIERRPIGPLVGESGVPISIRIDTNVLPGLALHFHAERSVYEAEIGMPTGAFLRVENHDVAAVTVRGMLSVTPDPASYHFMKADDFANRDLTLAPGESERIPIAFYFDATTATDPEMKGIRSATVSYSFTRSRTPAKATPLRSLVDSIAHDLATNATVTFSADPSE
jgi:cytochrome c oxidase assembly protein subunit 11